MPNSHTKKLAPSIRRVTWRERQTSRGTTTRQVHLKASPVLSRSSSPTKASASASAPENMDFHFGHDFNEQPRTSKVNFSSSIQSFTDLFDNNSHKMIIFASGCQRGLPIYIRLSNAKHRRRIGVVASVPKEMVSGGAWNAWENRFFARIAAGFNTPCCLFTEWNSGLEIILSHPG